MKLADLFNCLCNVIDQSLWLEFSIDNPLYYSKYMSFNLELLKIEVFDLCNLFVDAVVQYGVQQVLLFLQ